MKICINAGHAPGGNPDPGAIGETGLRESDVTYEIMQSMANYLEQVGYEILQVQDDNLQKICDASNDFGARLFISIHCNAAFNKEAQGTEVFYARPFGEGEKLAQCIQSEIIRHLATVDRGIKVGNELYVIKHTQCPAILIETAFISNHKDEALLANKQGKDDFARAIALGITTYVANLSQS